jgi:hypothetical protein
MGKDLAEKYFDQAIPIKKTPIAAQTQSMLIY